MTPDDYKKEYAYRFAERLGFICESSAHKGGQRPATESDLDDARRQVAHDMDVLEQAGDKL